jgi:hypothetical protein
MESLLQVYSIRYLAKHELCTPTLKFIESAGKYHSGREKTEHRVLDRKQKVIAFAKDFIEVVNLICFETVILVILPINEVCDIIVGHNVGI